MPSADQVVRRASLVLDRVGDTVVRSSHVVDRSRPDRPGDARCRHVLSLLPLTRVPSRTHSSPVPLVA